MTAATIEAVGQSAEGFVKGDRVAFPATLQPGSDIVGIDSLVGIPRDVEDVQAAHLLAPGLIARAMLKELRPVSRGERVAVTLRNETLRQVVAALARSLGAVIVGADENPDAVYDDRLREAAAQRAGVRQGRLQQAATDVFLAIRAGVFDGIEPWSHQADTVAA